MANSMFKVNFQYVLENGNLISRAKVIPAPDAAKAAQSVAEQLKAENRVFKITKTELFA